MSKGTFNANKNNFNEIFKKMNQILEYSKQKSKENRCALGVKILHRPKHSGISSKNGESYVYENIQICKTKSK